MPDFRHKKTGNPPIFDILPPKNRKKGGFPTLVSAPNPNGF